MNVNELLKRKPQQEMPCGVFSVTFDHIDYREKEGDLTGVFVHTVEFSPIFIPFTNGKTYQLDALLNQLGVDTYDPAEVNKCVGTIIKVSRYTKTTEEEITKTEAKKLRADFGDATKVTIELIEDQGKIIKRRIFINTNFNVDTIK